MKIAIPVMPLLLLLAVAVGIQAEPTGVALISISGADEIDKSMMIQFIQLVRNQLINLTGLDVLSENDLQRLFPGKQLDSVTFADIENLSAESRAKYFFISGTAFLDGGTVIVSLTVLNGETGKQVASITDSAGIDEMLQTDYAGIISRMANSISRSLDGFILGEALAKFVRPLNYTVGTTLSFPQMTIGLGTTIPLLLFEHAGELSVAVQTGLAAWESTVGFSASWAPDAFISSSSVLRLEWYDLELGTGFVFPLGPSLFLTAGVDFSTQWYGKATVDSVDILGTIMHPVVRELACLPELALTTGIRWKDHIEQWRFSAGFDMVARYFFQGSYSTQSYTANTQPDFTTFPVYPIINCYAGVLPYDLSVKGAVSVQYLFTDDFGLFFSATASLTVIALSDEAIYSAGYKTLPFFSNWQCYKLAVGVFLAGFVLEAGWEFPDQDAPVGSTLFVTLAFSG